MKLVNPGYEILTPIDGLEELKHIEKIARVCYKSEDKITDDGESAKEMIQMIINLGHEAMLEHSSLAVKFICDRGVSHEIVRHRIASFAQESTRYCNYSNNKFGNEISVIPIYEGIKLDISMQKKLLKGKLTKEAINAIFSEWETAMLNAERSYNRMIELGATPQIARSVLPNSTKTEIIMTANYREWRNFFKLRVAKDAHPQMRQITVSLLQDLKKRLPIIFDDIDIE